MAAMGGFDKPILHGLCTYGISGKHVFNKYGDFTRIQGRFSSPVFPGETLETLMWCEGDKVYFTTRVVERDVVCLANGYVQLLNQSKL